MKDKQKFIDIYNAIVNKDKQRYIEEHGTDAEYDWSHATEYISTAEEIVGYYITWYKNDALKEWLNNVEKKHWLSEVEDNKVTLILKELFSK